MVDEKLSACVVAYVGRPGQLSGPPPDERVRAALGADGVALVALVPAARAVVSALDHAEPAPWRAAEITEVAAQASAFLRQRFPELSDDAIRAVVNTYCYSWK